MDKEKLHQQILDDMHMLYIQKNAAYGDSFSKSFNEFGIIAPIVRISDKFNRICNLVKNPDVNTGDESIKDTLIDMANYCILTYMEIGSQEDYTNDKD